MAKKGPGQSRESRSSIRRGLTLAAIVEATGDAIRKDGVEGFSLDEVAEEMGLTKPALYYYFQTREMLLLEVFVVEKLRVAQAVHDAVEQTTSAAEAIRTYVETFFGYFADDMEVYRFVYQRPVLVDSDAESDLDSRLEPYRELLTGGLLARLEADREAGIIDIEDPLKLAFLAVTMTLGLLTFKSLTGPEYPQTYSDDDVVDELVQMLLRRLGLAS